MRLVVIDTQPAHVSRRWTPTLSSEAMQALRDEPREARARGFPAGRRRPPLRSRGSAGQAQGPCERSALIDEKAAFKVKFAKTDLLLGLKNLTLNNMAQDPSMVHEALGYEVLRAAGLPAPRTGFAYVRVNDARATALYLNLETI